MGKVLFWSILLVFLQAGAARLPEPLVPDHSTPGSVCTEDSEDFSEYRYDEEIPYCERDVSRALKDQVYRDYGVPSHCREQYTIDHFYPLALGGDNTRENLWPEHKAVKRSRYNLENDLYRRLSTGKITQQSALSIIRREKMNPDTGSISHGSYCELNIQFRF